jgi:hypothetical protein
MTKGKLWVVNNVPVEDVDAVVRAGVDEGEEGAHGKEVTRGVDQGAAVREDGEVCDGAHGKQTRGRGHVRAVTKKKLGESLDNARWSGEPRYYRGIRRDALEMFTGAESWAKLIEDWNDFPEHWPWLH